MDIRRSRITLENLQVKSLDKAKRLAFALSIIEEECGIHEVRISVSNFFICDWINLSELNETEMEKLLSELLLKIKSVK